MACLCDLFAAPFACCLGACCPPCLSLEHSALGNPPTRPFEVPPPLPHTIAPHHRPAVSYAGFESHANYYEQAPLIVYAWKNATFKGELLIPHPVSYSGTTLHSAFLLVQSLTGADSMHVPSCAAQVPSAGLVSAATLRHQLKLASSGSSSLHHPPCRRRLPGQSGRCVGG
jgi:hypothetical protein